MWSWIKICIKIKRVYSLISKRLLFFFMMEFSLFQQFFCAVIEKKICEYWSNFTMNINLSDHSKEFVYCKNWICSLCLVFVRPNIGFILHIHLYPHPKHVMGYIRFMEALVKLVWIGKWVFRLLENVPQFGRYYV